MQHFDAGAQVAAKQRTLEDALWHIGRVRAGAAAAADSRTRVGVPAPRAAVGAPRREEGRRARRLPRAQVELRRRHDVLRGAAARDLGAAADAADARRRAHRPRPAAADRARGGRRRRRRRTCSSCGFSSRSRPPTTAALRAFADAHGVQFYLQPGGPGTAAPLRSVRAASSRTRSPNSTSSSRTRRPTSRR